MADDRGSVEYQELVSVEGGGGGGGEGGGGFDPVRYAWEAIQGRLLLAACVGVVCAMVFGGLGFWFASRSIEYTSVGRIRIHPMFDATLFEDQALDRTRTYESFLNSQAREISSRRVLEWAVRDPQMREVGWDSGVSGVQSLMRRIEVTVPRNSQDILVGVEHGDPVITQKAVNAVLRAYVRLSQDAESQAYSDNEQDLVRLRDQYRRQRDEAGEERLRLAERHGTDDLERERDAKHDQLRRIDGIVRQMQIELATRLDAEDAAAEADTGDAAEMPLAALAARDPELARLLDEISRVETGVRSLGLGAQHPEVIRLRRRLEALLEEAAEREAEVRAAIARGDTMLGSGAGDAGLAVVGTEELATRLERMTVMRDELQDEVISLGRTQLQIDALRRREAEMERLRTKAEQRLEALRVEQQNRRQGTIEIAEFGAVPLEASTDNRTKFLAAGVAAGMFFGVGLVALPGLLRPTIRTVDSLEHADEWGRVTLLGVMPSFEGLDEEESSLVRENLLQIRSVLDAGRRSSADESVVYTVTSSGPGEGKTSMTLMLGRVFAKADRRVVMVDADFVGRGLSDMCDIDGSEGLLKLLRGGEMSNGLPVGETAVPGLDVMSTGMGEDDAEEWAFGPLELSRVVEGLRERYDVVLMDTGPLLGSSEATAAVSVCDETVLVVSRGQSKSMVSAARERLRRFGVGRVNIVFNRATWSDLQRYPGSTTSRTMSRRSQRDPGRRAEHSLLDVRSNGSRVGGGGV